MAKKELNASQLKVITYILEGCSIDEASKKAKVARTTVHNWLNQEHFEKCLEEERKAIFENGLNAIKAATAKAAQKMIELLDSPDRNTRRLAAKDILSFAIKVIEVKELEDRVSRLEELLENQRSFS